MFTLTDTDSGADSNRIGFYCYVKNRIQRNDIDTDACTDSNADGYCTRFGTNIGTDEVEFNSFSLLLYISITIGIGPSVALLHITRISMGIVIGIGLE